MLRSQLHRLTAPFVEQPPVQYPESTEEFRQKYPRLYASAYIDGEPTLSKFTGAEWGYMMAKVLCWVGCAKIHG